MGHRALAQMGIMKTWRCSRQANVECGLTQRWLPVCWPILRYRKSLTKLALHLHPLPLIPTAPTGCGPGHWQFLKHRDRLKQPKNLSPGQPPKNTFSTSSYQNPEYQAVAPFASTVLTSIEAADIESPAASPTPYKGVQYVDIPEFQAIGTQVGQRMAAALAGQDSVEQALRRSQAVAARFMRHTGYIE